MAIVSFNDGVDNLIFKPGNMQARRLQYSPRQRKLVSSNGTSRIIEISSVDELIIEIDVIQLPREDSGSYHGRDSLLTFIETNLNWAEETFTFTDADGDAHTVRYWSDDFLLEEAVPGARKDAYDGKLVLRVEPS